jgi:hypothetical protein
VAKVEEVKNRKIGDEGRWNEIVIAIVYAAMKSALKYSEIYSAILSDETLMVVTFLLFRLFCQLVKHVLLKRLVFCIPDLIIVNTFK